MQVIRGLHNITSVHRHTWVTIGNFDGLHLGHHALIKQLQAEAKQHQAKTMLINFYPSPDQYFHPDNPKAKLMRLHEKMALLQTWRLDYLLLLPFNETLARLPAQDFIENILIKKLDIKGIVIGDDFHFGYQRQGNIELLQQNAKTYACVIAEQQQEQALRISSTRVREALQTADFALVERLLGRPYSVSGRVRRGQARGRLLGFPTANIPLGRPVMPVLGVFAGWVQLSCGDILPAVANIGWRPTVGGTKEPLLEVHLLDYSGDLYEQRIDFFFAAKLRDEQKFTDLAALQVQLHVDIAMARHLLSQHKAPLL